MTFLADMGISQTTVSWLKERGYDALHVRDLGMQKSPDRVIFAKAEEDQRIVLTCDLDFGTILAASGKIFPSVILFRLDDETPFNINKRLELILNNEKNRLLTGAIIIVGQHKYRVRSLPIK